MSKENDYINRIENAERRFFTSNLSIESRSEGNENAPAVIEGYAFKYDQITTIGNYFREVIRPGAGKSNLLDDIRCLFNHNANLILGRSNNGKGTLEVFVDETGFGYRYTTPDRSYAKDLADSIERGDVDQSSFAFTSKKVAWIEEEGELDLREIYEFDKIYDVSPVTYPAYADTTVGKRSHEAYLESKNIQPKEEQKRAASLDVFEAQYLINKNKR